MWEVEDTMIIIEGGNILNGEISFQGAKNSMQFVVMSSLLTDETILVKNVPNIEDVITLNNIFNEIGALFEFDNQKNEVRINCKGVNLSKIPYNFGSKLRSVLLFIPGLLKRFNKAIIPYPGGDKIGNRPLDTHKYILESFGYNIIIDNGYIYIEKGTNKKREVLSLPFKSFTGTGMAYMLASFFEGSTIIKNVALEPELNDLVSLLRQMGVTVNWINSDTVEIIGKDNLKGGEISLLEDRLEIGSYIFSVLATGGEILVKPNHLKYLDVVCKTLKSCGVEFVQESDKIKIFVRDNLDSCEITTGPYPLFPTDLFPQFSALMCLAHGKSCLKDTMHDKRFNYCEELKKLGAEFVVNDNVMIIDKNKRKENNNKTKDVIEVKAKDIRGGMALLIYSLTLNKIVYISDEYHLRRGYSDLIYKYKKLGAKIRFM